MSAVLEWYREGGPIMHGILLAAVVGVALFVERLYHIVLRSKINGRAFIERVIPLVRSNKIEDAIRLCAESKAALADMGLLILRSRSRDEADLQNVAGAASAAIVPRLTRRLLYLPMLARVALLLGVLGTVLGLRAAFSAVAAVPPGGPPVRLAAGIAAALAPAAFGLVVAAPLTAAHAYLVSQSELISGEVGEFAIRLINALIDRPDVRLGHR